MPRARSAGRKSVTVDPSSTSERVLGKTPSTKLEERENEVKVL
jgi:hypothetical protein